MYLQRWRGSSTRRWWTRRNRSVRRCWTQRRGTRDFGRAVGRDIEARGNTSPTTYNPINNDTDTVSVQAGDPKPKVTQATTTTASAQASSGSGVGLYAIVLFGGALAFGAYKYLQSQEGKA